MTTTETPMQRMAREHRESLERARAAMTPRELKVAKAFAATEKERDQLTRADGLLDQAKAEVDALLRRQAELEALTRNETVLERSERGMARYVTRPPKGAAKAREELAEVQEQLEGARARLQSAIRSRNAAGRKVDAARFARRRQVLAETAPPSPAAQSRADRWTSTAALKRYDGGAA